ncbi:MAG: SPOR domain-containing protein [Burkholderiales bacterium]|nr:SPOR domain-containing protein [Burkholderiales bacterium]
MNFRNKQAGGTILGMIIGLVIGLSIAVVVAITINKTPVPFVNRAKQDKLIEPVASQGIDLNKSLYGNQAPAKEAAKEFVKEAEPTDPTAPDKKVDAKADIKTAKADGKPVDGKPVDNAAKPVDKTAAKDGVKPDATEEKWTYYLQAGAFREQTDAENTKAKLALLGVETRISERATDNGTLYRVRVGPFGEVDAMNKVRTKLSENGVDVAVVRIPK